MNVWELAHILLWHINRYVSFLAKKEQHIPESYVSIHQIYPEFSKKTSAITKIVWRLHVLLLKKKTGYVEKMISLSIDDFY